MSFIIDTFWFRFSSAHICPRFFLILVPFLSINRLFFLNFPYLILTSFLVFQFIFTFVQLLSFLKLVFFNIRLIGILDPIFLDSLPIYHYFSFLEEAVFITLNFEPKNISNSNLFIAFSLSLVIIWFLLNIIMFVEIRYS